MTLGTGRCAQFFILHSSFYIAVLAQDARDGRNLVANGDFEKEGPAGWQRADGLTSFRVDDEKRGGKCMKFDTDVKVGEFRARRAEMEQENPPPPKAKSPTKHPDYGTVAGLDGVSFYTEYIEIKPGMRYTLSMDARAEKKGMTPKVFLKGYAEVEEEALDEQDRKVKRTFRRVFYKVFKDCECDADWRNFSITVCPTIDSPDIKWVRIMLFPYWPQGLYWFDNVKLVEAGREPGVEERWKRKASDRVAEARRARDREVGEARATIKFVAAALERHKADTGAYPSTSQGLAALWNRPEGVEGWGGPYLTELDVDPWGAPYRYLCPGTRRADAYDLESFGPDGVDGGGDDVEN